MRTVVVKRSEWVRGSGALDSGLLTDDGKRCCLGFHAQALGIPDKYLSDAGAPHGLIHDHLNSRPGFLTEAQLTAYYDTLVDLKTIDNNTTRPMANDTCAVLMRVNDNRDMSDEERETTLTTVGRLNGINFVFED